jgi:hypothetical protein
VTPRLTTARAVTFRLLGCAGITACAFLAGTWFRERIAGDPKQMTGSLVMTPKSIPSFGHQHGRAPGVLTESDFAAAAEALRISGNGSNPQRDVLAACEKLLAEARTTEDFQRLVKLFNEAPLLKLVEPLIAAAFLRWVDIDPEAAATGVDALRYMHLRLGMVEAIFQKWMKSDPDAALAFLTKVPAGSVRRVGPGAAFRTLAELDPEAAARRALDWKVEVHPLSVLKAVFGTWAAKDAEAALNFARKETNPDRRSQMLSALMEVLPPAQAWREALAQGDPNSKETKDLLGHAVDRWGHHIEAPVAAVLALPPGDTRDEMMKRAAEHAAKQGLARGEALLNTMPDETTRLQWLAALARGTLQDPGHPRPAEAIRLAAQLPPGEAQRKLIAEAGERWGRLDPPAASEWLRQQPAGLLRDAFTSEFVRGTFASDPAAALTWAASIEDGILREQRLPELFARWKLRNAAAAAEWLQQANVSDHDRESLFLLNDR